MITLGEAVVGGWPYWGDLLHHSLLFFVLIFIVLVSGKHSCSLFIFPPLFVLKEKKEEGVLLLPIV